MSDLERILYKTPGSVSKQWYEAGAAVDPGTVTVNVTRADGTVVVTGGAVSGTGTGTRTYSLSTVVTDDLDTLTIEWVSTGKGTLYSTVEVVGGFLFSIAEARILRPLDNTTTYSTASLIAMRTVVEQALEDACGTAFVPRYALETLSTDYPALMVNNPKVRSVRSATDGTTPLTQDQLDALVVTGRSIYGLPWVPWDYRGWSGARVNVTVGYEHGYTVPPERVRRAALLLAKSWLVSGPIDDRASTFNAGADGGTYSLTTPGIRGSIFGLPEVDVVVQEYGSRVIAP